jgi:hypothetical protein
MGNLAKAMYRPHRCEIQERILSLSDSMLGGLEWLLPPESKPI